MWYNIIKSDMSKLPDMIDYYVKELESAQVESKITGSLEKNSQDLPGIMSHRFSQLQELEAILKWLNIQYDKIRSQGYKKYLERYNRDLSDRSIEKYLDGEPDIVDMNLLINEVALVRNKYLGLIKAFETKQYQIGNITRLRIAGLNDATL